jgi:hypothetical protein
MNKELVDYVKQQLAAKTPKNKIADVLLKQGWHQSEVDEAFLEVGAGGIEEASFDASQLDESGEGTGDGLNRKSVIIAGIGLAVLALVIGIIIFPSLGGKKDNSGGVQTVLPPVDNSAKATTTVDSAIKTEQKQTSVQTDPAVLAEIDKLATTIAAPSGWVARKGTISSRPLAAYFKPTAEKDSSGKDAFNENISITRDSLKSVGTADAAAYIAKSKTALQSKIADYKILSERKVNLSDGSQATLIGGSFGQNGMALKNMQLFAFSGDNVYVVTGAALAANWDSEKDMIGAAVLSFKFPNAN